MFLYCSSSTNIDCSATPFFTRVVKDRCMYKLNSIANVKENAAKKQYLVVKFVNKLIDQIKLKEIITSNISINVFPMNHNINGFRVPSISYQYSNTIRSNVLNYKQAIVGEDV